MIFQHSRKSLGCTWKKTDINGISSIRKTNISQEKFHQNKPIFSQKYWTKVKASQEIILTQLTYFSKSQEVVLLFVRCDQRSKVAVDYDSIRLEKNPGWCVVYGVYVIWHRMDFLSRFKPQRAETWCRPPGGIPI